MNQSVSVGNAGWGDKVFRNPGSRLLIGMLAVALPIAACQAVSRSYGEANGLTELDSFKLITNCIAILFGFFGYVLYTRTIERRWPSEISLKGFFPEFGKGVGLGVLLFGSTMAILWFFGYYELESTSSFAGTTTAFGISLTAFFEELLVRGVIYRILEEWLGTWIALAISALLFGLMHVANPNADIGSTAALALEAGLLLAAAYSLTHRLWFVTGLHFAWNYTQGGIFGLPISGSEVKGLFKGTVSGPEWISGGAFGVEASVVAVGVCVIAFLLIVRLLLRNNLIMQPSWKRS